MQPGCDETHDPARRSWVPGADGHRDFPVQNLPLGIFSTGDSGPRPGVAIGDSIADLRALADAGHLPAGIGTVLQDDCLNALLAQPALRKALRGALSTLLSDPARAAAVGAMLHDAADCTLHLPARIGDYTDFYVGIHHATNIGRLLRPDNPLLPNYKHVPIGYHGRASSVRPSGTPVIRPCGQRLPKGETAPVFGPTARLDYELELGVWIGPGNALGTPVPIADAGAHIAGLCLLNDWSARDVQAWEYQPLGPFLAKSFMTTVSPWIVTAEALMPFRLAQPSRPAGDPAPLAYLQDAADQRGGAFAIELQVHLRTASMRACGMPPHRLSRATATSLYWTVAQIVAHHTSNGCNLRPGDLLGTGTISSPDDDGCGSLMEISRNGAIAVALPNGERRTVLEDGDEILLSARADAAGAVSIGFGACAGMVVSAVMAAAGSVASAGLDTDTAQGVISPSE